MKKISLEPYKGTRDFYPEDMFYQNYIFSKMREVVESYGYLEYNASLLEETSLYESKSSEEIVNEQTYTFIDRGGRSVTIRPEMTPTVSRMVAKRRKSLAFPLRWYSIPNLFRYERPQRGRLREHWQLNVDLFGSNSLFADVEIIKIAYDILKKFAVKDENFIIKINSRKLLNYVFKKFLFLDEKKVLELSRLIDRKEKISQTVFLKEIERLLPSQQDFLFNLLNFNNIEELEEFFDDIQYEESGLSELKELFIILSKMGVNNIIFDFSLVRGFDYYTGIIFEIFDKGESNQRALCGGGRYDNLVDVFGVDPVSAVGFGMGDVALKDFLETYSLLPEYKTNLDLYVCVLNKNCLDGAEIFANDLRKKGLNVEVDISLRKISAQIKTAHKRKVKFVICIGENELENVQYKLKNIITGEEEILNKEQLIVRLKN